MPPKHTRYARILLIATLVVLSMGVYLLFTQYSGQQPPTVQEPESEQMVAVEPTPIVTVLGYSVAGRPIEAYTFGTGEHRLLFVGGIHGGYEWNSVLLTYELVDHFKQHPELIPDSVTATFIPSANPDGVFEVLGIEGKFSSADVPAAASANGAGRFNANNVDLNRNFDCKWKPESTWRGMPVSAGTAAFSEPEARIIRDFVLLHRPLAAIFFHSQSNAVYASECENGILPETRSIMNTYATASGYKAIDSFDAYEVTGDAEGWLASIGIPAITVELSTHESIEWDKNIAGITALLSYFSVR